MENRIKEIELAMINSVDEAFNAGILKNICGDVDSWQVVTDYIPALDRECCEDNLKQKAKRAKRRRSTRRICHKRSLFDLSMAVNPGNTKTEKGKETAERKIICCSQIGRYKSMASMEKPGRWNVCSQIKHGMTPARCREEEAAKSDLRKYQTETEWMVVQEKIMAEEVFYYDQVDFYLGGNIDPYDEDWDGLMEEAYA